MADGPIALELIHRLLDSSAHTVEDVEAVVQQWKNDNEFELVNALPDPPPSTGAASSSAGCCPSEQEKPSGSSRAPPLAPVLEAASAQRVVPLRAAEQVNPTARGRPSVVPGFSLRYIVLRSAKLPNALGVWEQTWGDLASMLKLPPGGLSAQTDVHLRRLRSQNPLAEAEELWLQQGLPLPVTYHCDP